MISATILADSINSAGERLTTVQYTAHRFILAEINTHRVFSRNARSSRAVPTQKLIEEVIDHPAMPIELAENRPGMVAGDHLPPEDRDRAADEWARASRDAAVHAGRLAAIGIHKQWANRVLEPFLWVHGIISSTSWGNFFKLRLAPDAQPEMRALAEAIRAAMDGSKPVEVRAGGWHRPYINEADMCAYGNEPDTLSRLSAARCARVSYAPFDGDASHEAEIKRSGHLLRSGHWSPFEHQAYASPGDDWRNFRGWRQYRAMIDGCGAD